MEVTASETESVFVQTVVEGFSSLGSEFSFGLGNRVTSGFGEIFPVTGEFFREAVVGGQVEFGSQGVGHHLLFEVFFSHFLGFNEDFLLSVQFLVFFGLSLQEKFLSFLENVLLAFSFFRFD